MPPAARSSLLAAAFLATLGLPAGAEQAALPSAVVGIDLLPGWREPGGARVAAIELRLAPGWHTYWRVPGDSGIPPQFDWSASENLAGVTYEWPRPGVFESFGEAMFGYADALVLPVVLTPERPDAPIEARVDVLFGLCNDICVPVAARLEARIEPSAPADGREKIERALADRPVGAKAAGVTRARCSLGAGATGATLTAEIDFAAPPPPGVAAVIEADRPDLWIGVPQTRVEGRRLRAVAPVESASGSGVALDRGGLRLTLIDPRRAIDIRGCASG
ncbi:MAG: hypothetical protein KBB57_17595 [Amaricoccus sp.]|nr:hypothetical protein [Amaricoccus sp.]